MQIGFVTLQYPPADPGGIGTYVGVVARSLAAAGHDVTVICAADGQRRSSTVEGGVRVERFGLLGPDRLRRRLVRPSQTQRIRLLHALSSAWALRRTGRAFDVVEVPEWKAQGLLLPRPSVVHLHLTLEIQHAWIGLHASWKVRLSYLLERMSVVRATTCTAASRQTTRLPSGRSWMPDERIQIVSPPLDLTQWSTDIDVETTEPVVLFVGRLEKRKAPELLVDALRQLREEGVRARAVFVGRPMQLDGRPYDEVLETAARAAQVPIELRSPIEDPVQLSRLYDQARVVAVPSHFETLSMVVLEAFASGRPAVMTDQVGAAEWLRNEVPECVVPADDARALADALRPHLTDPAHAGEVARRGRERVRELCSAERIVASRLVAYRSATSRSRSRGR